MDRWRSNTRYAFQHTAARRRLGIIRYKSSRRIMFQHTAARRRLEPILYQLSWPNQFQHTAARRRLVLDRFRFPFRPLVSTHSRPKAAGVFITAICNKQTVSTHSRPKAAGQARLLRWVSGKVSTHSRPKAAGRLISRQGQKGRCFNTQPPEGGWLNVPSWFLRSRVFQHTAARRRLAILWVICPIGF